MREQIERIFDEKIKDVFKSRPDLQKFFLRHERKSVCLDNLTAQVRTAEWQLGAKMDGVKFTAMIETVASMFCKAALGTKEKDLMSASEKARIQITNRDLLDLEKEIYEENAKVDRGQVIGRGYTGKLIKL
jgi:hypothetical protein